MKTVDEYMQIAYRMEIVEDMEEGGYAAAYPDLPGCISIGETISDVVEHLNDAKKVWLQAALEQGIEIPVPLTDQDYSGQFKLRIPKSLHRRLSEHSKQEGISMNQYCVYLLTMNDVIKHNE